MPTGNEWLSLQNPMYQPTGSAGLLSSLLEPIKYIGETIGKPAAALRGLLAGRPGELANLIPFSDTLGITDPNQRVSGRDMLRAWGMVGPQNNSGNFLGGLLAEVLTDPTMLAAPFGGIAKGTQLLSKAAGLGGKAATVGEVGGALGSRAAGLASKAGGLIPESAKTSMASAAGRAGNYADDLLQRATGQRMFTRGAGTPSTISPVNVPDELLSPMAGDLGFGTPALSTGGEMTQVGGLLRQQAGVPTPAGVAADAIAPVRATGDTMRQMKRIQDIEGQLALERSIGGDAVGMLEKEASLLRRSSPPMFPMGQVSPSGAPSVPINLDGGKFIQNMAATGKAIPGTPGVEPLLGRGMSAARGFMQDAPMWTGIPAARSMGRSFMNQPAGALIPELSLGSSAMDMANEPDPMELQQLMMLMQAGRRKSPMRQAAGY